MKPESGQQGFTPGGGGSLAISSKSAFILSASALQVSTAAVTTWATVFSLHSKHNFQNLTLMDSASAASFEVRYLMAAALSSFPATITPVVFMTHSATQHCLIIPGPSALPGGGAPAGGGFAVSQVLKTSCEISSGT